MSAERLTPALGPEVFPFGFDFQRALLRLILADPQFGNVVVPHVREGYFESEALVWAFKLIRSFRERFNALPPLQVLLEEARLLAPPQGEIYQAILESVRSADLSAEAWLRTKTLDWIRMNIFHAGYRRVRDLYNEGKFDEAYEANARVADQIQNLSFKLIDREFFFDEWGQRFARRLGEDPLSARIATGIRQLDHILRGGLSIGELGIWIAHAKGGKSTMLVNLGAQAVRRGDANVLHVVLEGSRQQTAARYDSCFARQHYDLVCGGRLSDEIMRALRYDYDLLRQRLVILALTEKFGYTVADIQDELQELKRQYNWVPRVIIVDYGDLLRSRDRAGSETEAQRGAFRDLKIIANRGYAVWTASQSQRLGDVDENEERLITSRQIADCYDKVRVADFIGSINWTPRERDAGFGRLFAELYRDNVAGQVIPVAVNLACMRITNLDPTFQPPVEPKITQLKQIRAPA